MSVPQRWPGRHRAQNSLSVLFIHSIPEKAGRISPYWKNKTGKALQTQYYRAGSRNRSDHLVASCHRQASKELGDKSFRLALAMGKARGDYRLLVLPEFGGKSLQFGGTAGSSVTFALGKLLGSLDRVGCDRLSPACASTACAAIDSPIPTSHRASAERKSPTKVLGGRSR